MDRIDRRVKVIDPKEYYKDFWEILESILNATLFVMIGLMALDISVCRYAYIVVPAGIMILLISRGAGVFLSSVLTGRSIPGNYNLKEFVVLMTWSALKGGLSLALAMSTAEYLAPDIYNLFINVTYVTIFFTVLVQGLTIKNVYFKLEKHKSDRREGIV
jgi:CPA1 family monovalent cation:H+ antiporter